MTPKQTALVRMAGMLGIALVAGAMANAVFTYFTLEQIGVGFSIGMLAYMAYMVYQIELARAERLESLNKLNNPDA